MKKYLFITLLIFLISITLVSAASYTQTAADISPGVFADGEYYFPETLSVGTDAASSVGTALFIGEDASAYGIYYSGDKYAYPFVLNSDYASVGYGIYVTVPNGIGVYAETEDGHGLYGKATGTGEGVYAVATGGGPAVYGYDSSGSGIGVKAASGNYGVYVTSSSGNNDPAYGVYVTDADTYGVYVVASDHYGGKFVGSTGGVYGEGDYYGVYGTSGDTGVKGIGDTIGVYGTSDTTGVYGYSSSSSTYQCGIKGYNSAGGNTGYVGCYNFGLYTPDDAKIEGDLTVNDGCTGCDIAEHFLGENLEAGDVVVLDPASLQQVKKTNKPYDKLAAGIVSTDPTITMGLEQGIPIALSGVVPVKVVGVVHVGELLTTSSTAGYAMACPDYQKCAGAIIGKAMEENTGGKAKITALVMLG